jgi:hypothetical protein
MAISSHRICLEMPTLPPHPVVAYSTPGAQQRSQLNQQCLTAMTHWLQAEFALGARVYPNSAALPSIWEVVTGTALTVASRRLVLIPTVAIELDELRVPQEWVDIPDWIADYYIALRVDPDPGEIEIAGYTSHYHLKTTGVYDVGDRTYAIDVDDLWQDLNGGVMAWQLRPAVNPEAALKAAVAALPPLPQAQADSLLERLGNPTLIFPQRAVPFAQWAALLHHGGWRQRLYERRQGLDAPTSMSQWIRAGVPEWAQQVGWQSRVGNLAGTGVRSLQTGLAKPLTILGEAYELRVFPMGQSGGAIWRIELRSGRSEGIIPDGFKLRLLTEDLQMMDNNEDQAMTAVDHLFIDVVLEPGEGLVWEVEPQPDDYDREILRF